MVRLRRHFVYVRHIIPPLANVERGALSRAAISIGIVAAIIFPASDYRLLIFDSIFVTTARLSLTACCGITELSKRRRKVGRKRAKLQKSGY